MSAAGAIMDEGRVPNPTARLTFMGVGLYAIWKGVLPPVYGLWLSLHTPLRIETAMWTILYYFLTGVGVTAGYHRLWSHKSYNAGSLLQLYLLLGGAAGFQKSALWWATTHRVHHRYVDTPEDPHSIEQGIFHAHMGWILFPRQTPLPAVDIKDLTSNRLVMWQHNNYEVISLIMGIVFPTVVAGYGWNDWWGGLAYSALLRIFFFQQGTFCINSLAHWLGDTPYDDKHSPRDHLFTAILTLGEGYHNFHHEFPTDYRNGVKWWQYDPSKWFIWVCEQTGFADDLSRSSDNVIGKGEYQQQNKKLEVFKSSLKWGVPPAQLPQMTWQDFEGAVKDGGQSLIIINGIVHDIEPFYNEHPGGKGIISAYIGKDATAQFNGEVYEHSNAAHNLLDDFRIAALVGADEPEKEK
ncbi:Acyl-CoA desaturase [Lachnellula hyalina]|uniref:Acyl-CoA desaturase n=1 Tax=Lachnellula hyalina TaxID=1316788 RepID=A0A8H8R6J5_9HELO|nr:Acyl-CoA desaturase [Lachnellula hyalina]TVY29289.1 Acyl-CoA desaturase [Lachnellula hyalina]